MKNMLKMFLVMVTLGFAVNGYGIIQQTASQQAASQQAKALAALQQAKYNCQDALTENSSDIHRADSSCNIACQGLNYSSGKCENTVKSCICKLPLPLRK